MFNKNPDQKLCPLLKKACIKHECQWYTHIRGTHPQTGEYVDTFDCSMVVMPILMIENAQQSRQTGAAVESFRNEMVKANESSNRLLAAAQQTMLKGH